MTDKRYRGGSPLAGSGQSVPGMHALDASSPDSRPSDRVRVRARIPAGLRDRVERLAEERGLTRSEAVAEVLDRGLRRVVTVVASGTGGRPDLVHLGLDDDGDPAVARVGLERTDGRPPVIPDGYSDGPAARGGRGRDGDADVRGRGPGFAASIGSVLGLDGGGGGAAGAGHPGSSGSAAGPVATPEAVEAAPVPTRFLPQGRHVHSMLWGVGLAGAALLVLLAVLGPRFEVAVPGGSGGVRAGAYVLDRWTGRLWYCDSAPRGRPAPVCVEFERAQGPRVDGS